MLLFCNNRNISFLKHFLMLLWCHLFAVALGSLFALLVSAVMGGAQRLPVRLIPEHHHIASVRDDVIDNIGKLDPAFAFAIHAQRMAAQVAGPRLLPFVTIAALRAGLPLGTP